MPIYHSDQSILPLPSLPRVFPNPDPTVACVLVYTLYPSMCCRCCWIGHILIQPFRPNRIPHNDDDDDDLFDVVGFGI